MGGQWAARAAPPVAPRARAFEKTTAHCHPLTTRPLQARAVTAAGAVDALRKWYLHLRRGQHSGSDSTWFDPNFELRVIPIYPFSVDCSAHSPLLCTCAALRDLIRHDLWAQPDLPPSGGEPDLPPSFWEGQKPSDLSRLLSLIPSESPPPLVSPSGPSESTAKVRVRQIPTPQPASIPLTPTLAPCLPPPLDGPGSR